MSFLPIYTPRSSITPTIRLLLTPSSTPIAPFELLSVLHPQTYTKRIDTLTTLLNRYVWNLTMRLWLIIGLVVTLVAPWPITYLINQFLLKDLNLSSDLDGGIIIDQEQSDQLYKARLATFGALLGLIIVIWVPYGAWRYNGNKKITSLLAEWTQIDSAPSKSTQ